MISGGIFDVAQKQSSLEDINLKLSDESTWSNLELSQSLNKEKADLEKFLDLFLLVDEAISDNLDLINLANENQMTFCMLMEVADKINGKNVNLKTNDIRRLMSESNLNCNKNYLLH